MTGPEGITQHGPGGVERTAQIVIGVEVRNPRARDVASLVGSALIVDQAGAALGIFTVDDVRDRIALEPERLDAPIADAELEREFADREARVEAMLRYAIACLTEPDDDRKAVYDQILAGFRALPATPEAGVP